MIFFCLLISFGGYPWLFFNLFMFFGDAIHLCFILAAFFLGGEWLLMTFLAAHAILSFVFAADVFFRGYTHDFLPAHIFWSGYS